MSGMPWKLAGYLVERPIGAGASGQVWQGRTARGEPVALKRVPLADAQQARAALTEAALLTTLEHPHLVRVHEVLPTADAVVLVLDLAAGGSLAELLRARGRLAPGEVITALAPIAAAVAYAHAAGVVHGDVTPGNVLFTEAGFPLLADLGVARLLGDRDPVYSTPAYLDPAVAAGGLPAPQSDVFMLGAVALHALTGSGLWPGDAPAALAAARGAQLPDVAGRLSAAGVPLEVADVVSRALAPEPTHRGTAADFALELRYAGEPIAVELTAGRIDVSTSGRDDERLLGSVRLAGGPAPALNAGSAPAGSPGGAAAGGAAPGRPEFATAAPSEAGGQPPGTAPSGRGRHSAAAIHTHAIAPRPRPERGRRRRVRSSAWEHPAARWGLAVGCATALAVGAGVAWSQFGDAAPARHQAVVVPTSPAAPTGQPVGTGGTAPAAAAGATARPSPLDAAGAAQVLADLDSVRERAFARRTPLLLSGVYVPGPLLAADTRLLENLVPPGCGLQGVRTTYSRVRVLGRSGGGVRLSVEATLSESLLVCSGTAKASAAGSGPSALRIDLVARGGGYLIGAIS